MSPKPTHNPTAWVWVCRALELITMGYRGHRWMTMSYEPKRRLCHRCGSVEGPAW